MSVDYNKAITAEDLIRRYKLNSLNSDRKTINETKRELEKVNNSTNQFAESVLKSIDELQSQVDGNITTWFFNEVPTLDNSPANEWTTEKEKNNHLGDLYYDNSTGYAYRFALENDEYNWLKIVDSDVVEALAIANSAQDTADKKRQVFVDIPSPPYEVGDMWIKDDKEIYRCRAKRTSGDYSEVDWVKATEYTNDDYAKNVESVLNQFKSTVETDYATKVLLETTEEDIRTSVEAVTTKTEEINEMVSEIQNDVNENSLNINNNYQELNEKLNEKATIENVTEVIKKVETLQSSTDYTITVLEDIQVNGVSKVETETGYVFDKDGLSIDKTDAPTGGKFNEAGMEIVDKLTAALTTLFYSGYVNEEMAQKVDALTKYMGQTVTYTNSLIFQKYLSSMNMRLEDIEHDVFGKGLGFFTIGDDE